MTMSASASSGRSRRTSSAGQRSAGRRRARVPRALARGDPPRIRAELGPNAVVVRQRERRAGGLGGFFAQRYFEIEATLPGPTIDVRDDDEDEPTPEIYQWVVDGVGGTPAPSATA